jgi:hypothetical protein
MTDTLQGQLSSVPPSSPRQPDLFDDVRQPVVAAWGGGVNSTAMLIELIAQEEPIDAVLFADTGGEDPRTYRFIEVFGRWLADHDVSLTTVRYVPRDFKNWPPYRTLEENCLTNGTLPSRAFGFGSCSVKWKIAPQNRWVAQWPPAQAIWAVGRKVIKLIGYDCTPADDRRYAEAASLDDPHYEYRYPLRTWGWDRNDCEQRIRRAGFSVPPKSACFFCPVTRPHELRAMSLYQLRRIVLLEARAKPRLRTIEGLWRKSIKGHRGATPRPGSMTEYIRSERLLPAAEIDAIIALAPLALIRWQERFREREHTQELSEWLRVFDASAATLHVSGLTDLYDRVQSSQPLSSASKHTPKESEIMF